MGGTNFATGTYTVGYYDGAGIKLSTDAGLTVASNGLLWSQIQTNGNASAVAGVWHALVQPAFGYSSFASNYSIVIANPSIYGLLENDAFTVELSAIPEFPMVITGIIVIGICGGIYYCVRKRIK